MNIRIDELFRRNYDAEITLGVPGNGNEQVFYVPDESGGANRDGLIVSLSPKAAATWVGMFSFATKDRSTKSGIYSSPNPNELFVVSRGGGFRQSALLSNDFQKVPIFPIFDVRQIPESGLVLFSDFTRICAFNRDGLAWITQALSWDGIKIVEITNEALSGIGWDSPAGHEAPFTVHLRNGMHSGGSAPPSVD